ncbi:MAG TPA: PDZ domain-containing protein [Candidatus Sulfopaludibacter sp.]|jgi:tricorn protease|nr:PDZ domain-containing protein [Candidatus Sulfopaludibacter sp.]
MRCLLVLVLLGLPSFSQTTHLLLRSPALSRTQIVFSYAGDLWSVPREGGEARRLTAGVGEEAGPIFSPDGSLIAFTGEYDGNTDVYVIPAAGGMPKRLTWHPGPDHAVAWTPDGKRILFASRRDSGTDAIHLFTTPVDGGAPEELPLPNGESGSYSPDGTHLAYVPLFQWQSAWKRYRGGQTRKVWLANLADSSVTAVPRENSNDFEPMWVAEKIYFLSDRNGPVTLFSYDTKSKQVKQLVENHGLDLKSASAGPGAIVYEQFGALYLYDLRTGQSKAVDVRLAGDFPELRTHYVSIAKRLRNPDLSPSGARAVFEARGEILTVPAEKGDARNITQTTGANERNPVWSPDGQTIAYLSDETGDYQLHLKSQDGTGDVRKIKLGDKPSFYTSLDWSPDSRKIAYTDNHLRLWYIDLEEKKPVLVDTDFYQDSVDMAPAWSPDSKWLAYVKQLKSHMSAVFLYSMTSAAATQVTDGMSRAKTPAFDHDGKYLYFLASTNAGPSSEPDVGNFSRPVTYSVYLMVLAKDQASPFAPESDDEKKTKSKSDLISVEDFFPKKKEDAKKDEKDKEIITKIDLDNIGQRILSLPMPPRRYAGIAAGKPGIVFVVEQPPAVSEGDQQATVQRYDLNKRKGDVAVRGVQQFTVSFDGEKMLYQQGDKWTIAAAADNSDPKELKTGDLQVRVEPAAEWKQMYHEAWRIVRDFFYDPAYHGLDLQAAEEKYSVYLNSIASRDDLNYLFTEMLGELTVGHEFIGGGDTPDVKHIPTGLLGADYKLENGRYRFARIFNGENWNPGMTAPLTQPGVNVQVGDYLLAVNGRELRGTEDVYSLFEMTAGKATILQVAADASGANARDVTVVPIESESNLRHLAWVEDNRRKVDQLSGGRIAYVHMPDTAGGGYTAFTRYFFAQVGKEAAIIDDRFNHGGSLATDIVEYLQRKPMSYITFRDGADLAQPQGAIFGPKVMITNEFAGSGGDAMPWYFRRAGVGKLVGMRTWGGLVGLAGFPELMDGGTVTAPNAAVWNPNGTFDVENHGVAPDIEVDMDPALVRQGHDPQLEKAVQVLMEQLPKTPAALPSRPSYPNYHKK